MEVTRYPEHMVFGLDIGTRNLVGTVGYRVNEHLFRVAAQCIKEHDTRAMLDGQIHDILKVSDSISYVKRQLEEQIGRKLEEVCIAAAGRVLKTITVRADMELQTETIIKEEHIYALDMLAIEKAYDIIREKKQEEKITFYCVGYSVIHYYLNDYPMTKLEEHKASKISVDLIATFLPEEVIDGLYSSVENAGLQVANLTLEPIAAIQIAIPERFRLLNIALVDIGAGTSDISITKDGSIVAYGMIPYAGDEITENIAREYLAEFNEAEQIKQGCLKTEAIIYNDIMGIAHKIMPAEVLEKVKSVIDMITKAIADKIIELNGGKAVSAVFVVGGGGKIPGFVETLAEDLGLPHERVALRGEEVLGEVEFLQQDVRKDPLLVTPIGICLSYYEQSNNFIYVNVNGERVKLYDNGRLTIADAAVQIGFPNEQLFPRRGHALNFTVNGNKRMIRGELGEAAVIMQNGKLSGINMPVEKNDKIEIIPSTIGKDASYEIRQMAEYHAEIIFEFNGKRIVCPKFACVNQELVSEFYQIQDGDEIEILNYYTLEQVLTFMDVEYDGRVYVNHVPADLKTKVYENFTIDCTMEEETSYESYAAWDYTIKEVEKAQAEQIQTQGEETHTISVIVNETPITMTGKSNYILVDVLDYYSFDLSEMKGSSLETTINGIVAEFSSPLKEGDKVSIYWKK